MASPARPLGGPNHADVVTAIVELWADLNPVAGYTSGHLATLSSLFVETAENLEAMRERIDQLAQRVADIAHVDLRATAAAVLTSLRTQLDLPRPSGAGPSGTGMGGVYAAADGIFYIVLKQDFKASFVADYLDAVLATVEFETKRWWGQDFTVLVRRECIDTATYMEGTLSSLVQVQPDLRPQCDAIRAAVQTYKQMFVVPGLDSNDFAVYWPVFQKSAAVYGPVQARGYPQCLERYYQLSETAEQIEVMAQAWLDLDMAVTTSIAQRVAQLPFVSDARSLQEVWDKVSQHYAVDFGTWMNRVVKACNDFGARYVIAHTAADKVLFDATPDYLVNLITGGEDFAVDYLSAADAYSQLYLTTAKNTSMLTMLNILVHEASHGFNFVLSAKEAASPLLNLNTALEVPMTEGMAFCREFQYWAAAQDLVGRTDLDPVQETYLSLYGTTAEEQAQGVLCAQLETYIWRVIRYVRALCDVRVNGGTVTYPDFIAWAAAATGLSEETLHGECFTFMASPGYAPCYAVGGVSYAALQQQGSSRGVSAIDFNTFASRQGFYAWPVAKALLAAHVSGGQGR
ncbi:MAG TPA: hypothetical protein VG452_08095 [Egibacteraceae bacterium]|nr:hypothetical protein [Egibacteraceae bacterium]